MLGSRAAKLQRLEASYKVINCASGLVSSTSCVTCYPEVIAETVPVRISTISPVALRVFFLCFAFQRERNGSRLC